MRAHHERGRAQWAKASGRPRESSRAGGERPCTSQETADKGPPKRAWQAHRSLSDLGRATPPLPCCEITAGRVKSAGVRNSREGIATPNRALFLLLSNWAMGLVYDEGS